MADELSTSTHSLAGAERRPLLTAHTKETNHVANMTRAGRRRNDTFDPGAAHPRRLRRATATTSELYYFQTSGPAAGLGIGDSYTSTGGAVLEPAPNDHQLRIQVPCTGGTLPPVLVELFDPELGAMLRTSTRTFTVERDVSTDRANRILATLRRGVK